MPASFDFTPSSAVPSRVRRRSPWLLLVVGLVVGVVASAAEGDPVLDDLAKLLKAKEPAERIKAAERLGAMKDGARPVARALCEAMLDKNEDVRQAAAEAIEKVAPELYKPVRECILAEPTQKIAAVLQLSKMGPKASPAIPVIYFVIQSQMDFRLRDGRPDKQRFEGAISMGIETIHTIDPSDARLARFCRVVAAGPEGVGMSARCNAITMLGKLCKDDEPTRKEHLPAIVGYISNRDLRLNAMSALGDIGKPAESALPALRKLKLDPDKSVRDVATSAVEKIQGK